MSAPACLRLYVTATWLAALAVVAALALVGDRGGPGSYWLAAAFAGLVALDSVFSVRLKVRGEEGDSRSHEEGLLVAMAVLLAPLPALVAYAAGVGIGQLFKRRGSLKEAFNFAQLTGSAALGLLVVSALSSPQTEPGPVRLLAALAGVAVFCTANRAVVAGVLRVAGAGTFRENFFGDLGSNAAIAGGNASIGLLVGVAASLDPWLLPFALAAMGALSFALSGHVRARQERHKLEELVGSSSDAIFSTDRGGRIAVWNPSMERIAGIPAAQARGELAEVLVRLRDDDGGTVVSLLARDEPAGPRLVRAQPGQSLSLSRSPLPDGGFVFVMQDTTELRSAEAALRESEQRLRLALEAGRMGWWEWDLASGRIDWSESLELLNGLEPGTFGGTFADFLATIHPDDREQVSLETEPALAEGRSEIVFRARRPDGAIRWVEDMGKVVPDGDGCPIKMVGVQRDVTDRVEAEEALRRSRELYRLVVENATDMISLLDPRGRIVYASPSHETVLGYSAAELEALDGWASIVHPDDVAQARSAFAPGGGPRATVRLRHKDGHWVFVEGESTGVLGPSGEVELIVAVSRDVSERETAQLECVRLELELRQAQKLEAVGQLAGGVAHDFNNMMSAVVGFSELALSRLEPEHPVREHVAQIRRAGERSSELTNQLLAFSRKQVLQPKVIDLNAAVTNAEQLLRRLIGEDIDLVSVLDPQVAAVVVDSGQLEQVIVNLVINARDAMPDGGRLTLETASVELDGRQGSSHFDVSPGPYAVLAVTDTGVGMDADTLAQVFDPFFTTKELGKGTGLGLSTVYGILKQSGGDVSVYSEPGSGTTFKIYLPQVKTPAGRGDLEDARVPARPGTETVLLVEDEDVVRRLGREVLEEQGYTVLEAAAPGEALWISESHEGTIDLLFTDVVMPEMNGRELAERLAPLRPEMKVLYASGYADEAIVRHGVLEPGTAFLPKPLTPRAIAAAVRDVLDG